MPGMVVMACPAVSSYWVQLLSNGPIPPILASAADRTCCYAPGDAVACIRMDSSYAYRYPEIHIIGILNANEMSREAMCTLTSSPFALQENTFYADQLFVPGKLPYYHNYAPSFPGDAVSGDRLLHNEKSALLAGRFMAMLRSGSAYVSVSSITGRNTAVSIHHLQRTYGHMTATAIHKGLTMYMEGVAADVTQGLGGTFSTEERGDEKSRFMTPDQDKQVGFYRYRRYSGGRVYGDARVIFAKPEGPDVTLDSLTDSPPPALAAELMEYDGQYTLQSVTGIKLETVPEVKAPYIQGKLVGDYKAFNLTEEPYSMLLDEDCLLPDPVQDVDSPALLSDDKAEYDDITSAELVAAGDTDRQVNRYFGKNTFELLPGGGFRLRDAWGSEIRMDHGNIYLTPSGNLITTPGRDILTVAGGAISTVSKGSMHCRAEGEMKFHAAKELGMRGDEQLILEAPEQLTMTTSRWMVAAGDTMIKSKGKGITGNGSFALVVDGPLNMAASQTAISANTLSLASGTSAITLGASIALLGGQVTCTGRLMLAQSERTLPFTTIANDGTVSTEDRTYKYTADTMYCTNGGITASGSIMTEAGISAGSVNAQSGYFGNGTKDSGVMGGKAPQVRMQYPAADTAASSIINGAKKALASVLKWAGVDKKGVRWFRFKARSKAFNMRLSDWQTTGPGSALSYTPTKLADNTKNYPYPGERSWTVAGLNDILNDNKEGISNLKVNKANEEIK